MSIISTHLFVLFLVLLVLQVTILAVSRGWLSHLGWMVHRGQPVLGYQYAQSFYSQTKRFKHPYSSRPLRWSFLDLGRLQKSLYESTLILEVLHYGRVKQYSHGVKSSRRKVLQVSIGSCIKCYEQGVYINTANAEWEALCFNHADQYADDQKLKSLEEAFSDASHEFVLAPSGEMRESIVHRKALTS